MNEEIEDEAVVVDDAEAELTPPQTALAKVKPQASWEYKTEFGVNTQMRKIIDLTIKVAETEIEGYKRKIDKLTYGS